MTTSPIDRLFPLPQPEPAPGCPVCADLDRNRAVAQAVDDYSRVSDCNIGLRAHGKHGPGKT